MENNVYFDINGKDARETWGIYMGEGSLSALMTPSSNKAYIESECADEDGKRVIVRDTRLSDRDINLVIFLVAKTFDEFIAKYGLFCEELAGGALDIETRYQPGVVYHCNYVSCSQFEQWDGRVAKFSLRLNEPNPKNRRK